MARYAVLAMLAAVLLLFVPSCLVMAHTEASDGRISAFLHIAPDDKPQPGKTNTLHFYFNDQDSRFTMEGCDCYVQVNEGKQVLYKGGLPAEARRTGILKVFLPINNFSYDVIVNGSPKTAGFFQPFNLKFDLDVGHPPPAPPPNHSHAALEFAFGLLGPVAAAAMVYHRRHR